MLLKSFYYYFCYWIQKMNLPGAVGVSLALETIFQHLPMDLRPIRFIVLLNLFHDLKWKHLANLY